MKLCITMTALGLALGSTATQAETQKWRLTAVVTSVSDGFQPPFRLEIGKTVNVDYVIDMDASRSQWGDFNGAISRIRFDKDASPSGGYILGWDGLTALNAQPNEVRPDGADFVSFNCFAGENTLTVQQALDTCAAVAYPGSYQSEVRFDFGPDSVYAAPQSFVRRFTEGNGKP